MLRVSALFTGLAAAMALLPAQAATDVLRTADSAASAALRRSIDPPAEARHLAMTLAPMTAVAANGEKAMRRHAVGPRVQIRVDLSEQRMTVVVEGKPAYSWPVSTGRRGYLTPTGFWTPYRMHTMWRSRKYDNAPMPHAIFFHRGYAIHGTAYVKRLGRPASHGCVRLSPDNATRLFELVKSYGRRAVRVSIAP